MNELVVFLLAGAFLFLLFLLLLLSGRPAGADQTLPLAPLEQMLSLRGLAFDKADLLLDDGDYRWLRAHPSLNRLAEELRRDRRRIVWLWLKLLREDVRNLWRFRRLLVGQGVSVGLAEELRIAASALAALGLLWILQAAVAVVGPFGLALSLRRAREQVEAASHLCAALLQRIPRSSWPEIERKWAAESAADS